MDLNNCLTSLINSYIGYESDDERLCAGFKPHTKGLVICLVGNFSFYESVFGDIVKDGDYSSRSYNGYGIKPQFVVLTTPPTIDTYDDILANKTADITTFIVVRHPNRLDDESRSIVDYIITIDKEEICSWSQIV